MINSLNVRRTLACTLITAGLSLAVPVNANPLSILSTGSRIAALVGDNSSPSTASSRVDGVNLDQKVIIQGSNILNGQILANQLLVNGSDVALLNGTQLLRIDGSTISQSDITANTIVIDTSDLGVAGFEQLVEIIGSTLQGVQMNINGLVVQ